MSTTLTANPRAQTPSPPHATGTTGTIRIVLAAIVAAAFGLMLWLHAEALWRLSYYQFFPFVLLGSGFLAWSRWDDVEALVPGNPGLATVGFLTAWGFLMAAEILVSPAVAYLGALVFLAAGIYRLGGFALFRAMLPAWAFLWILVPLPFRMGQRLLLMLQSVATQWSSFVLDSFHVYHVREGNVIQIPGHRLLVEEACTGANSLFSVVACCLFLVWWTRQRWYRALVLLAVSILWVLVTNCVRIVTVAYAYDRYQVDFGHGVRHDLLGFACFALAIWLIWSTDRLLLFFFPRWGAVPPRPERSTATPTVRWSQLAALCPAPIAAAFALPLALHLASPFLIVTPIEPTYPLIAALDDEKFPKAINEDTLKNVLPSEWVLDSGVGKVAFEYQKHEKKIEFGDYSKVWRFKSTRFPGLYATVSLDYPFPAFHDLWLCYETNGWTWISENRHENSEVKGTPRHWFEFNCKKTGMRDCYVAYAETNAHGDFLEFQTRHKEGINRFEETLAHWADKLQGKTPKKLVPRGPAYQIQVVVENAGPLDINEVLSMRELFFASVEKLRGEMFPATKEQTK